ncbi:DUF2163 domain-containing protein [Burkholderia ubonensis]|uniref:DUF2163 domain-containing protein n=1 Tax=Burkholderia ubonensis TaxID=101571 RepID=UPI00075B5784|nr:DUF2163 domain-containing protein [Burkholderia ubonensis]KVD63251.1 hypothetical protein WI88_09915 [Burkholderia ubonensis]
MKTITTAMKGYLQGTLTTFCTCWLITRQDGVKRGFTDNDVDLTINGQTYYRITGYDPTAIVSSSDMSVDNLEVEGLFNSGYITEIDMDTGVYDGALVDVYMVNRFDTSAGMLQLRSGYIGQGNYENNSFKVEVRGLHQKHSQQILESISAVCLAKFGDSRCQIDLTKFTFSGVVQSVPSNVQVTTNLTNDAATFKGGILTWTTGANAGRKIKVHAFGQPAGVLTFVFPPDFPMAVGDTFSIIAGCDRQKATCQKYGNYINFRGFADVPDPMQVMRPGGETAQ